MNRFGCSKYACSITVLLALLIAPGIASAQQSSKPAPPAPPAAPSASQRVVIRCGGVDLCAEQIQDLARTISQDVVTQLSDLKEEIATEVQMSSPELSKLRDLSAELADKRAELAELGAEMGADMAARGRELAQEIQEQTQEFMTETPGIRVHVADEGGGWLGIEIGEVTQEKARELKLSSARGVVVTDVEPDSPAAKAGLKEKDVITRYDGQTVEGTVQFRRLVHETPPGRTVSLAVSRDGATQNISVELGDRSAFFEKRMKGKMRDFGEMNVPVLPNYPMPDVHEGVDRRTPVLGISAEDLTGQLGEYFGAPDNSSVLVREVRSGTPAEKAGLKAGDVIVKLNDKPVHSLTDLRGQLREKSAEKSVTLGLLRKGSSMTVTVGIELPRPGESMHHVHRAQS
jgi:serine protease Do